MKRKTIPAKRLINYPVMLSPVPSDVVPHVVPWRDGKFAVFHGPCEGSRQAIVHEGLSELQVLCLQVVLSYRDPVPVNYYRAHLTRIMCAAPDRTLQQLADSVLADVGWVQELLQIETVIPGAPAANLYALSRLPVARREKFVGRCRSMRYSQFAPLVRGAMQL